VHVRVMRHCRAPAVQNRGDANARSQMLRIAYSDEAGRGFRSEAGRCSDVKPATIPI